jgi:hypothetical protein
MGIDLKACEGLAIVTKSFQVEECGGVILEIFSF